MNKKRAQAWGFDLIVGAMIFLAGIAFFYFYTINYSNGGEEMYQALQKEGALISDSLLSEGSPPDWNEDTVVRIGILTNGRIDETKLQQFRTLAENNYAKTKSLFRIKNEYFIYFDENPADGIGVSSAETKNLLKTTRVVIYQNKITTMNLYLWN